MFFSISFKPDSYDFHKLVFPHTEELRRFTLKGRYDAAYLLLLFYIWKMMFNL